MIKLALGVKKSIKKNRLNKVQTVNVNKCVPKI